MVSSGFAFVRWAQVEPLMSHCNCFLRVSIDGSSEESSLNLMRNWQLWDSSAALDWNQTTGHIEMGCWAFQVLLVCGGQGKGTVGTLTQAGTECAVFTLCSLGAPGQRPSAGCWQVWCWSCCPQWPCWPYV